jgi:hypothetical protein
MVLKTDKNPAENFKGKAGPGRPKGLQNKTTTLLKDAILKAATTAGNGDMATYLAQQAKDNPGPFMALLGKVLPMQIDGSVTHEAGDTIAALMAEINGLTRSK